MKTNLYITILFLLGLHGILSAQHVLRSEQHLPRAGEEIIKQQVEYKNPGRSGENVLWDFGKLTPVNDAYTLSYFEPEMTEDSLYIMGMDTIQAKHLTQGGLLIGNEHHTMYYYHFTDSLLSLLGHENPTTLLKYTGQRLITAIYPMHYQDSCKHNYQARGFYSSTIPFTTGGEAQIKTDAYGMMILPSGDTLRNVLRTRTTQTIRQLFVMNDTLTVQQNSSVETFKWYSKGYRYPIFETIQTTILGDSAETVNFETAFFFPPQKHYYLEEDTVNLALLEQEAAALALPGQETSVDDDPWAGLTYNFFPNPVKNTPLEVELYLPCRAENIRIQLRNTMGLIVIDENKGSQPEGICRFQLPTYTLPVDNYILSIWLNEKLISGVILKR